MPAGIARRTSCALVIVSLLFSSCERRMVTVEGTVLYRGKPVPAGEVRFVATDGSTRSSAIGADGTYKIVGCALGEVQIEVEAKQAKMSERASKNPDAIEPTEKDPPPAVITSLIPVKYATAKTSGLSAKIVFGTQKLDVELRD